MPFINTKTNVSVSAEQERELVKELGRAIAIIPGKSEPVLMLNLQDNQRMAFRGTADGKMAMVEVGLLGKAPARSLNDFTAECCNILNRILGIPGNGVYISYLEYEHWGYDGENF